jgi:hypothetical protein
MPKVELGTFGVVAGEELEIKNKNLPAGGALSWQCFLRLGRLVKINKLKSKAGSPPGFWAPALVVAARMAPDPVGLAEF